MTLLKTTWRGSNDIRWYRYWLCLDVDLMFICETTRGEFFVKKFEVMTFACLISPAEASPTVRVRLDGRSLLRMSGRIEYDLFLCNRLLVTNVSSSPLLLDDLRGFHSTGSILNIII